jgi:CRP/FNR family transcriptional regulator, anaerobic regulatory protein
MNGKEPDNLIPLSAVKVECRDCALFQLCLPIGIDRADLTLLDRIIRRRRPVKRGEYLYRAGDAFESIYAVKSGSFKTFSFTEDGREQVTGLYLPGELFGMDAISSGRYCCAAAALERSSVCEIPFDRLEELGARVPGLMRQVVRIMSKDIQRDKRLMQITKNNAEGRLAAFLLNLSERFRERGFAAAEYRLGMSRIDIGNYLGLADETVSRLFTRFQEAGLLETDHRRIRLIDISRLHAVARGLGGRPVPKVLPGNGPRPAEDDAHWLDWDPGYSIGIDAIDRQHRELFDISHRFYDAWRQHARRAALRRIFDELLEYVGYHFAEEERLMERVHFPDLPAHHTHHEHLVDLVHRYRALLAAGAPDAETQALEFLKTWLRSHVLEADREIGVFLGGGTRAGRRSRTSA